MGGVVVIGGGAKYDQSSPAATAKSFIVAMLDGDSEGLRTLTKDIIPWSYMDSDLLGYSTQHMTGWSIGDYYYYQDGNAIVVYNKSATPSPETRDFFCMDFVRADGKFFINDLSLPGYVRGWHSATNAYDWDSYCQAGIDNGGTKFK